MTRKRNSEDLLANSAAAAVPARRKAAPRTRAKHSAVPADAPAVAVPETETAAPQPVSAELPTYEPTHEEIAALAFTYWAGRGYQGGSPEEDWLRAETELRSQMCSAAIA